MTESMRLDFHTYIFNITDKYVCEDCKDRSMGPRHVSFPGLNLADVLIQCEKCGTAEYIKIKK
ncbi:hypothetical protein [Halobacillus seohaensis]|uniref:Uncharacterized protein n=1 Tax=Halobacillus seohaensis TaxID=447421 RepID=A0ABW2ER43_9BACI